MNFDKIKNVTILDRIELLEHWILVHAYLYEELNVSIVSDAMYDNNAHTLAKAIKKYPKQFKNSKYYKLFKDYDGNTAFEVVQRLKNDKKMLEIVHFDIRMLKIDKNC